MFDIRVGHLGGGSDFEGFSYVIGIPAADFGYMVQKIIQLTCSKLMVSHFLYRKTAFIQRNILCMIVII